MNPVHRVDADGWSLAVEEHAPTGPERGVVLAGHAMMCDRRTLDRPREAGLASTLAASGLRVYTFDSRGHGQSGPTAGQGGRWTYDDVVERDWPAVVAWARARHPAGPLAAIGHSLTGHALVFWLGLTPDAPVDAAVTIGANVWMRRHEPSRRLWLRKRATIEAWRAITLALGRFPARRLRIGTDDEAAEYVLDLCRFVREGRCRRRAGGDYLDGLPRVRPPVLALVGGADDVMCHVESARRFHAAIPRHELRVVPGVDHMGLVLAPQMADVWRDVAGFILTAPRDGR